MSLQDLNFLKQYSVSEHDVSLTERVCRVSLAMLHKEPSFDEEYTLLVRRFRDALIYAQGMTLGPECAIKDMPKARLDAWRRGLDNLQAGLNALVQNGDASSNSVASMIRNEFTTVISARLKTQKEYNRAIERAVSELQQTNAHRLRIATQGIKNSFSEAGIEREEHLRVARHSLHDLLGDLEGESCSAGWCLYGFVGLWSDADPSEARRTLGTAVRRLRLSEQTLAAAALRAKAYLCRYKGDFDGSLQDTLRAHETCPDPDLAIEGLYSALQIHDNASAMKFLDSCLTISPLWAVMILGDPDLASVHKHAMGCFDRQSAAIKSEIDRLLEFSICKADALREISTHSDVELGAALEKLQPTEEFCEQVKQAETMDLFAIKMIIEQNLKDGEKLALEAMDARLQRGAIRVIEMEARQKNLEIDRKQRLAAEKQRLDHSLEAMRERHKAKLASIKVTDVSAGKMFMLSGIIFLSYLGIGTFFAMTGVGAGISRPFSVVGLGLSVWPILQLMIKQSMYSFREWSTLNTMKHEVAKFQVQYKDSLQKVDEEARTKMEAAEEGYHKLRDDVQALREAIKNYMALRRKPVDITELRLKAA